MAKETTLLYKKNCAELIFYTYYFYWLYYDIGLIPFILMNRETHEMAVHKKDCSSP